MPSQLFCYIQCIRANFFCMKGHRWLSQWWLNLYPHWMFPATALAVIILLFQFPSQWRFHNLTHDSTPCSFRWQHCALCRALPSQQLLAHRSAAEGRLPHNSDRWRTSWWKCVQNLCTRRRRQISAAGDSLSAQRLTYLRKHNVGCQLWDLQTICWQLGNSGSRCILFVCKIRKLFAALQVMLEARRYLCSRDDSSVSEWTRCSLQEIKIAVCPHAFCHSQLF